MRLTVIRSSSDASQVLFKIQGVDRMGFMKKNLAVIVRALILYIVSAQQVYAHLMVAQQGTLKLINDNAFMVLSLPISAFEGIDDNNDGKITMVEFNHHRTAIIGAIKQNVTLGSAQENAPLEGIMLSPVRPRDADSQVILQLAVMGRFALAETETRLLFHMGLYGKLDTEQTLEITATRQHDNQITVFALTPASPGRLIFPED